MATITKREIIERIADESHRPQQDVKRIVNRFLHMITEELGAGNRLEFRDFGIFEAIERAPRVAQNPRTQETVPIPSRRVVRFKSGRSLRAAIDDLAVPHGYTDDGEFDD